MRRPERLSADQYAATKATWDKAKPDQRLRWHGYMQYELVLTRVNDGWQAVVVALTLLFSGLVTTGLVLSQHLTLGQARLPLLLAGAGLCVLLVLCVVYGLREWARPKGINELYRYLTATAEIPVANHMIRSRYDDVWQPSTATTKVPATDWYALTKISAEVQLRRCQQKHNRSLLALSALLGIGSVVSLLWLV